MKFIKDKKIWLILFFGFLLRQIPLNQSFWLDEATSGIVVRDLTFNEILFKFLPGDFHPPFYYLILKVWSLGFGTSEISLRSFSLITGLLTIYLLLLISKQLNFKSNYIAPLLLALSGLHIYYSSEARMYSLAAFFVTASVLFFLRTVSSNSFKNWFLFSLFLFLSIGTHYLTFLIIPVYLIFGIVNKFTLEWWKKFVASQIPILVGLILWAPILIKQLGGGVNVSSSSPLWANVLGKTSIKEIALLFVKFTLGRISFENNLVYGIIIILCILPLAYLCLKVIQNYKNNLFIILYLTIPVLLGGLVGVFVPVFSYFRFLFVLPIFYLFIAKGIELTKNPKLFIYIFMTINIFSSFYYLFSQKFNKEDWRSLVGFIETVRSENSQVIFVANSQMEGYKYYSKNAKIVGPESFDPTSQEVWLVRYVKEIFDPSDKLKRKVEETGFQKAGNFDFNGIPVLRYENSN